MADFKDITGWREELRDLEAGPARKKLYSEELYPNGYRTGPSPNIPLSNIYEFAELLLRLEETQNAMLAVHKWEEDNREAIESATTDTRNDPTYPRVEKRLLSAFAGWYELKVLVGPNSPILTRHGGEIALNALLGRFPSIRSQQAYEYANEQSKIEMDIPSPDKLN